jgi:uncharacterized protein YeaO (DUF488 family)
MADSSGSADSAKQADWSVGMTDQDEHAVDRHQRPRLPLAEPNVRVRRIYDEPDALDGIRVLVDRLWPRGVGKAKAELDEWCKDVAPSRALRAWYVHDPAKFPEFRRRYRAELEEPARAEALQHLRVLADGHRLTLLTATKRPDISEAAVLADLLRA